MAENNDFMAMLTGLTGLEDTREAFSQEEPAPPVDATEAVGPDVYRSFKRRSGPTEVASRHNHVDPLFASAGMVDTSTSSKDTGMSWLPAKKEKPFMAPKLQPFFQEDTVTQFVTAKPVEEIYSSLLRAMRENECMYSADREHGTIKLTAFVDHSRVEATVRVYRQNASYLVRYGRNYGDRIPATRLYFTLANASGLTAKQLPLPRLLRKSRRLCCANAAAEGSEAKASDDTAAVEAQTVYVDMLSSMFPEEALVGAQGLARACCCRTSASAYVPHLPQIVAALTKLQATAGSTHPATQDVLICLADVIGSVSSAALAAEVADTATVQTAVDPLLRCAALVNGDVQCAQHSLVALTAISAGSSAIRAILCDSHRLLVDEAITGRGPCSENGNAPAFLKAAALQLKDTLGL